MITAYDSSILPPSYSETARGGPEFATAVVRSGLGGEIAHRNINREDFISRYEIEYKDLAAERKDALKRFVVTRDGRARSFRFLAPDDSTLENEIVGVLSGGDIVPLVSADGTQREFFVIQTYADASSSYIRRIVKASPFDNWTIVIKDAGGGQIAAGVFPADSPGEVLAAAKIITLAEIGNVWLDIELGKLVFETAPPAGSRIYLSGVYHIIAAFSEDAQNFLIDEGGTGEVTLQIEEVLPVEIGISELNVITPVFISINLTAPAGNAVVSAGLTISATAPNAGSVAFYLDDRLVGEASAAPFSVTIDSTLYAEGFHSVRAAARGASGQIAYSQAVTVNFQNVGVPVLSGVILSPTSVRLTWTSAAGAAGYKLSVDGTADAEQGSAREATITNLSAGKHKFRVKAYNADGFESAFSNEVILTPTPPPSYILFDSATGDVLFDTATNTVLEDSHGD